jgi:hypothetical protein
MDSALPASVPPTPAGVLVVRVGLGQHPAGRLAGDAERAGRHPAADGLAQRDHVRVQVPGRGATARAGRQGVRLVDDEQRARGPGEVAQRLVVAGVGKDDAHVGHGRLGQHAGHVAVGQRRLELTEVVELDRDRGLASCCLQLQPLFP